MEDDLTLMEDGLAPMEEDLILMEDGRNLDLKIFITARGLIVHL
jgi:hypothetical protein